MPIQFGFNHVWRGSNRFDYVALFLKIRLDTTNTSFQMRQIINKWIDICRLRCSWPSGAWVSAHYTGGYTSCTVWVNSITANLLLIMINILRGYINLVCTFLWWHRRHAIGALGRFVEGLICCSLLLLPSFTCLLPLLLLTWSLRFLDSFDDDILYFWNVRTVMENGLEKEQKKA